MLWLFCWLVVAPPLFAQTVPSTAAVGEGMATAFQGWGAYMKSILGGYAPTALPWVYTTLAILAGVAVAVGIVRKL